MIDLTPEAQQKLDAYLQRVRTELAGSRTVAADEVEQDLREHVDVALAGAAGPVDSARITIILDRLGAPERWLPDEDRPLWRRALARVQTAPEDWRLAYASLALFVFAVLLIPVGFGVVLLIASFLLSRAYCEYMRSRGDDLGARRWLVYPPIALILAVTLGAIVIGPAAPLMAWAVEGHGAARFLDVPAASYGQVRFYSGLAGIAFGSWWIIAAGLMTAFLRPLRFVFAPLLDGIRPRHFAVLAAIGAIVGTAGGLLVYYR